MQLAAGARPTMYGGNLYPMAFANAPQAQTVTKPVTSADMPKSVTPGGKLNANIPVLSQLSTRSGMSIPMLFAMGGIAWFLFRQYD